MAYNYEYPYVSGDRQNADWLLKTVQDLDKKVNDILAGKVDEMKPLILNMIEEYLNTISLDYIVSYEEETETISFKIKLKQTFADGLHVFDPNEHTLTIKEE